MELSKMKMSELQSLQDRLSKELEARKQNEKKEAIKQIKEIADKAGLSLEDLVGKKPSKKKSVAKKSVAKKSVKKKATVQYRDPEDATKTWAGRGRKPKWLVDALENGKKLEDFAV